MRGKILFSIIVVAMIITITIAYSQAEINKESKSPIVAKNYRLSELANSLKPIYPEVNIIRGKVTTINGIELKEIARTTTSKYIIKDSNGISRVITKDGEAEFILYSSSIENKIIIATITNTNTVPFYITQFTINGGIQNGPMPLYAKAIDTDYSLEVFGYIPKPPITEPYLLNPGESLSVMINGKWSLELLNMSIDTISAGVQYDYDLGYHDVKMPDWREIGIVDLKLP